MHALLKLLREEDGTTAVEYAVMLGLVIIAAIAGIVTVGQGNGGMWSNNSQQLSGSLGS